MALRTALHAMLFAFVTFALLGISVLLALLWHLKPVPGEWQMQITQTSLPAAFRNKAPPWSVPISVPATLRLLSHPTTARWLHGRQMPTRFGRITWQWDADAHMQTLHCQPCVLQLRALGPQPLRLPQARVSIRREHGHFTGRLQAGGVQGSWQAQLAPDGVHVEISMQEQSIAQAFALLHNQIPEARIARIQGSFDLEASVRLPAGSIAAAPQLHGFAVQGLGTERLRHASTTCHAKRPSDAPPHAPLDANSPLARAVIAAEDQRFYQHSGYDMAALLTSMQFNQSQPDGGPQRLRGGSTLTQQLAKLAYTGTDRSPARKLRELLYAVEMEQTLGKNRILQLYLAHAPWGGGACGAQAAAQHYFHRPAEKLSLAQSAWLAAMLNQPERHLANWRRTGQIDVKRAQWVAQQMRIPNRPLSQRNRANLVRQLERVRWPAPAV